MNSIKTLFFGFWAVVFLIACGNDKPAPIEINSNQTIEETTSISVTPAQFAAAEMRLGQVKPTVFAQTIPVTGSLDVPAKSRASVSAYFGGYVKNLNLMLGEKVNRGQVLFSLENPDFVQMQQEYLEAKEQLAFLQADVERLRTLSSENIASQKDYLKADATYKVTRTQAEGLKKKLSLLNIKTDNLSATDLVSTVQIYAPISGYITDVKATKGMFLGPTDVAVKITAIDKLHLELDVFERDILKIKKGQDIRFRIPDASKETFAGTVHIISKIIDPTKRTVNVNGHLKDESNQQNFVPGMYVEAEIVIDSSPALGLPEAAVIAVQDKFFVLVKVERGGNSTEFEQREVQVGQRFDGMVEILNADTFKAQDSILVRGAFNLVSEE